MFRTLFVALLSLALLAPGSAYSDPKKVRIWASGNSVSAAATDVDGNGTGYTSYLKGGGNLGPFTLTNAGDVAEWDGVSFCNFDPESGLPDSVEIYYLANSSVLRTIGGDQLFLELNTSPPSPYCVTFANTSATFELYADVVGGTGRFEGATGSIHFTGEVPQVLQLLTPFEIKGEGTIDIPRRRP